MVGFGARTLDPKGVPKYVNSPSTPLFDKSHILFGLDMAKEAIRSQDIAIIVEGYFDVIQAHQAGFRNVVASMGTALTEAQLRKLARYTKRFALALDPDVAGSEATLRAIQTAGEALEKELEPVINPRGMLRFEERLKAEFLVITLPPGKDPDALIRESPETWQRAVSEASPMLEFYLKALTRRFDLASPRGKVEAVRAVAPLLRELRSEVERDHYIHKLARLVRVDEVAIRREVASVRRPRKRSPAPAQASAPAGGGLGLEEYTLGLLLRHPRLLPTIAERMSSMEMEPLNDRDFAEPANREIFSRWQHHLTVDGGDAGGFAESLEQPLRDRVHEILNKLDRAPEPPVEKLVGQTLHCVLRLREQNLRRFLQELRFLQEDAAERGERDGASYYADLVRGYARQLAELHRHLAQVARELTGLHPSSGGVDGGTTL